MIIIKNEKKVVQYRIAYHMTYNEYYSKKTESVPYVYLRLAKNGWWTLYVYDQAGGESHGTTKDPSRALEKAINYAKNWGEGNYHFDKEGIENFKRDVINSKQDL